jgi:MFS family permease
MGMRMAENISYYLFTVISITFLTTYVGTTGDKSIILKALLIGAVVHFVTIPLIGALSDKVGRRPLYIAGAIGVAAWSWIFFDLIASKSETKILLAVVVGLILHALMYSPQAAFFSELFGTSVRYTGASVGYQLASIFAGALAPIIAIKLLGPATNGAANVDSVAIYMTIASVITLIAVFFAKETARTSLRHDRVLDESRDVTSTR